MKLLAPYFQFALGDVPPSPATSHAGEIVYLLCALTALACAVLLYRAYKKSHAKMLLWSAWCFLFLTLNNIILFIDLIVLPGPDYDLRPLRDLTGLLAMLVLVFGLILFSD